MAKKPKYDKAIERLEREELRLLKILDYAHRGCFSLNAESVPEILRGLDTVRALLKKRMQYRRQGRKHTDPRERLRLAEVVCASILTSLEAGDPLDNDIISEALSNWQHHAGTKHRRPTILDAKETPQSQADYDVLNTERGQQIDDRRLDQSLQDCCGRFVDFYHPLPTDSPMFSPYLMEERLGGIVKVKDPSDDSFESEGWEMAKTPPTSP